MNNEIKEILDDLFKDENVNGFILSDERYKEFKNYITKLQQENDSLKQENTFLKMNISSILYGSDEK